MSTTPQPNNSEVDIGTLFLANFVHQVVNPLNGIIGTLDNITDGTYKGEAVLQKINASRAQLEQCVTLIRNLAYLSDFFFEAPDKGTLRKPREGGSSVLPQVVIEAAQFFQVLAEKKAIRIEFPEAHSQQYRIRVRPELFRQLFINIFDNWLKYGEDNQKILVHAKTNSRKELVVEISGRSIGFNNSDSEKLFELGYRSSEAKNKVAQGSGIGLFICKQIAVRALNGTISAEHRSSGETIFRIGIPRAQWEL